MTDCVFCEEKSDGTQMFVGQSMDGLAWAKFDPNPVSMGHMLILPTRHVEKVHELTIEEWAAMGFMARMWTRTQRAGGVDDFTIGINDGPAAGQTILHVHMHVIPRRYGDVLDPRGGVRGVIPAKKIPGQ